MHATNNTYMGGLRGGVHLLYSLRVAGKIMIIHLIGRMV